MTAAFFDELPFRPPLFRTPKGDAIVHLATVVVKSLASIHRGAGRAALQAMVEAADRHGVRLELTAATATSRERQTDDLRRAGVVLRELRFRRHRARRGRLRLHDPGAQKSLMGLEGKFRSTREQLSRRSLPPHIGKK